LTRPKLVAAVHRSYFAVGSERVLTNTIGGSRIPLARHGLEAQIAEINRAGVAIARASGAGIVGVSVGPSGALLEPYGDASAAELEDSFAAQLEACQEADVIWIETMTDGAEARIALDAARQATALPVVVTFVYESGKQGLKTIMGQSPEEIAAEFQDADALGVNCSTPETCLQGVRAHRSKLPGTPLVARPNAGTPRWERGRTLFPLSPEGFEKETAELAQWTAVLGGCCGTTPEHLRLLKRRHQ